MYQGAARLLARSQHPGVKERLISCSVRAVDLMTAQYEFADKVQREQFLPPAWEGFSFKRETNAESRAGECRCQAARHT